MTSLPRLLFRLLLGRRLPVTRGTLRVSGARRSIVVRRDRYGIPHIQAESDEDAWYGLGFCQGQDRAFQLETLLRVARGTLAELVGVEGLPIDRLSRRIGFARAAEKQMPVLSEEVKRTLEAFSAGVTEGSRVGCRRKPHEFTLLRARPTPFGAADVVAIIKLQSFGLASNWDSELARLKVLEQDGPQALSALDPTYPEWLPVTAPVGAVPTPAPYRLSQDLAALARVVRLGGASNNWAIAPSRTASGRPILANDPHLPPSLPPHWYLAHVSAPGWAVAGAAFVGTPPIVVGHNHVAAWGVTAGMADNTDLYLEEVGADGRSVRQGEGFVACEVVEEVIHVRRGATVREDVLVTPRGPVMGPALKGEGRAISVSAVWLQPRPIEGMLAVHRKSSFEEFRRAFARWPLVSLNMVYADASGTIGWQLVGELPRRRKGWGSLPSSGADPEGGWHEEPVPFDDMPHLSNPATGFVATANTQPTTGEAGPFLGADWIDGYRLARITEVVGTRHDWNVRDTMALQSDLKSIPWQELRDVVLGAPAVSEDARRAHDLLAGWDGVVGADSPAAAVFELFLAAMALRVAQAKAPHSYAWSLGRGHLRDIPYTSFAVRRVAHLVRLLREQPQGWFSQPWGDEIFGALADAAGRLRQRWGDDTDRWRWGKVRPLRLLHPVGAKAPLGRIFNRGPFPWGGDANTVNQAATGPLDPTGNPFFIASLRMVVEVGDWEGARFSLPGGQSGNPLSPHYDDLLPLWRRGEGIPIAWSPDEVERATRDTLRLVPTHAGEPGN